MKENNWKDIKLLFVSDMPLRYSLSCRLNNIDNACQLEHRRSFDSSFESGSSNIDLYFGSVSSIFNILEHFPLTHV